jgi:DNA-binding MarR family transcriptional regulator
MALIGYQGSPHTHGADALEMCGIMSAIANATFTQDTRTRGEFDPPRLQPDRSLDATRLRAYTRIVTSDADQVVDEACYCKLARRVSSSLTSIYERELAPFGITLPQFSLLRIAGRHGPLGVSELAEKLHVDRTTLARNLKLLDKSGLITFAPNRDDQREKWVVVTVSGRKRFAEASVAWAEAQRRVKRGLGKQKLAALAELADALTAL